MNIQVGDTALITSDGWFVAPDGSHYRSVFGTVKGVYDSESVLGVRTNAKSTNWYVGIGDMLLAGCQIHYAIKCKRERVNFGKATDNYVHEGKEVEQLVKSRIYDADES